MRDTLQFVVPVEVREASDGPPILSRHESYRREGTRRAGGQKCLRRLLGGMAF